MKSLPTDGSPFLCALIRGLPSVLILNYDTSQGQSFSQNWNHSVTISWHFFIRFVYWMHRVKWRGEWWARRNLFHSSLYDLHLFLMPDWAEALRASSGIIMSPTGGHGGLPILLIFISHWSQSLINFVEGCTDFRYTQSVVNTGIISILEPSPWNSKYPSEI